MSQSNITHSPLIAFQLKGSLFTLTVLQLIHADITLFSAHLETMTQQAPKFFKQAPIVIDLQRLSNPDQPIDFVTIVDELRRQGLIPVGIRGGNAQHQIAAIAAGLAILPETKAEIPTEAPNKTPETRSSPASKPPPCSKVITNPVRSGQQIYAKGCDLIVLAPVSAGAELLADGHIHIYAPLRGRALAGVSGDQKARIFCYSLEAELVSIAGHYWVKEDLKTPKGQPVHIYLADERLHISTFD